MRFSIGHRLFLAMLCAVLAASAIGIALVRWSLFDSPAAYPAEVETGQLLGLDSALAEQYRQHHGWSFLPAGAAARTAWLRDTLDHLPQASRAPWSRQANLDDRIGLLDASDRLLAGVVANRAAIVFANIDTVRRPVIVDGRPVGALVLARPGNPDDTLAVAFLIQQQHKLPLIAGIGALLSALAAALLAAGFRKPIKQLVAGARRLEQGRFDTRIGSRRSDELGELAATFDHLAARLQEAERSRRAWVAATSHELRTPLSVLRAQMEALQDGVRSATPENVAVMLRQVGLLGKLVEELYQLAQTDAGQWHCETNDTEVWPLVLEALEGFAEKFRKAGLSLAVGPRPPSALVRGDADRLRQVLSNLLENSLRYTAAGGRIEVAGSVSEGELQVTIDDSAPAVPEPLLARLGERFYRVEPSRSRQHGGAGLGLALCRQIVDAHHGRLIFSPSPLGGLRVTLALGLA